MSNPTDKREIQFPPFLQKTAQDVPAAAKPLAAPEEAAQDKLAAVTKPAVSPEEATPSEQPAAPPDGAGQSEQTPATKPTIILEDEVPDESTAPLTLLARPQALRELAQAMRTGLSKAAPPAKPNTKKDDSESAAVNK